MTRYQLLPATSVLSAKYGYPLPQPYTADTIAVAPGD